MPFSFGVGDSIAVLGLAKTVIDACRHGPKEYQEAGNKAKALHGVLQRVLDDARQPRSLLNKHGQEREAEFHPIVSSCKDILNTLQIIIDQNSTLRDQGPRSPRSRRLWHAYRTSRSELKTITSRLTFYVACIDAFLVSLQGSAVARIERKIDEIHAQLTQPRESASVGQLDTESIFETQSVDCISQCSVAESIRSRLDTDEEEVWKQLKAALKNANLSVVDLNAYRDVVISYLKDKLDSCLRVETSGPDNSTASRSDLLRWTSYQSSPELVFGDQDVEVCMSTPQLGAIDGNKRDLMRSTATSAT